ncbi:MAG: type II secretion system protein N [Alcanivorax sp.]|nr:type II secretion system protein N [Alcanivorax sp.]
MALLRWAGALLLVIALGWLLAQTFWLLWYGPRDIAPLDSSLPRLDHAAGGQQVTLSQTQVDSWQLFGVYQAKPSGQEQPTDAPDTRLRLELLGVFQTSDTSKATAIIAEQGKEGKLYHIGDSIPGNASLEEVYPDRVILRRAGRLETLRWSQTALGGVTEVQPGQPPATAPASSRTPAPDTGSSQVSLPRQRQTLLRRLGLEPVSQGQDRGYRLGSKAPKEVIQQVGLKPDDVILSVNGYSLGTQDNDLAALKSYQDTRQATIVVQRGDQQFTVNYPP